MATVNTTTTWPGTIRLASDADTPRIGELYRICQWADHGVDWTRPGVGAWWLIAEREGQVLGALQLIASKPFGYIGDIVVHPSERGQSGNGTSGLCQTFGILARTLYASALYILEAAGVEVVMGIVAESATSLQRVLQRHGATDLGHYVLMARRTGA